IRKPLKNGFLAKLEDGVKLGADERQRQFAKRWERQRIVDAITNARLAWLQLIKDVVMHPLSVGSFQLLINKLDRWVPAADSCPPRQRQAVKKDCVVDECSFFHANWQRGENPEAKGGRGDSYQIGGI